VIKSFFSNFYIFLSILTVGIFYSIDIPPDNHWIFAFLPLLIPVLLFVNLITIFWFLYKKNYKVLILNLFILLVGWKFIPRTFQIRLKEPIAGKYSVFSYNVRVFNTYAHLSKNGKASEQIVKYTSNKKADIKCFQEFYYSPKSDFADNPDLFNTIKKLRRDNPYYFFKPVTITQNRHHFGLAIFSKYPIVRKGEITFPISTNNQAIFVDTQIGNDTVRVYNVHLQSMSIDENNLPSGNSEENTSRVKKLAKKIKWGANRRTGQVEALLKNIESCPYQVLVCGDLNDTPYSYAYEQLNEKLENAFEVKGSGFGFTYINPKLFFLRIDNIFASREITINSFKILDQIRYSDHFPLEATFTIHPN
jgi:endonuclease/exonuclease/phosphatase family metal-dependent hydrolase